MDALQSEDSAENPTTISSKNDDSFKSDLVFNQIKSEERVIEPISEIKRAPKTVREPISRRAVTPFQVTQKTNPNPSQTAESEYKARLQELETNFKEKQLHFEQEMLEKEKEAQQNRQDLERNLKEKLEQQYNEQVATIKEEKE